MKKFDLEATISAWRHFIQTERAISTEDADELECHLRDQFEELTSEGMQPEAAFEQSLKELGGQVELTTAYRSIFWRKVKSDHNIFDEIKLRRDLFISYIKAALRSMRKQKVYTTINIVGLAIGIMCCSIIFLFSESELRFDRFHEHADRIVRIAEDLQTSDQMLYQDSSAPPMGPAFVEDFTEVESMVRIRFTNRRFKHEDRQFQENRLFYADSTFFQVFSFQLIQGNPATVLAAPFSLVLTETAAKKYFGGQNAIDKILIDENGTAYTVTGIAADPPLHSHIQFNGLISQISRNAWAPNWETQWFANSYYTYLLLREGTDIQQLEAKIPDFIERRIGDLQRRIGTGYKQLPLIPLTEIHLSNHRSRGFGSEGRRLYIYLFGIIAVFILLIACMNFINLAIARSADRAKEVGLRKVVGAHRSQLAIQFLSESFLVTLFATILALGLCWLVLPSLTSFINIPLSLATLFKGFNVTVIPVLILAIGLIAGGYPAIILANFRPIKILKGDSDLKKQRAYLRKGMVIFQFSISMILIVCTSVVVNQLNHLKKQPLGFTDANVLIVDFNRDKDVLSLAGVIKSSFLTQPAVNAVSMSRDVPGTGFGNLYSTIEVAPGENQQASLNYYMADTDFIDTYELELLAGRSFSRNFPTDTLESIVINRAMLSQFNWSSPLEALGKKFTVLERPMKVIGVVENFNYQSLRNQIRPLGIFIQPESYEVLSVRLKTPETTEVIANLKETWEALVPHRQFEAVLLEDQMYNQYRVEQIFATIFRFASGFAIFIACLGLFGLTAFTAQQRTKEIGVRKVLGASIPQILALLSKDFTRLLILAFIVATPLSYFAANAWLAEFAYKTEISLWTFAVAGTIAFLVAGCTVSYQSYKAASINPVDAIKSH